MSVSTEKATLQVTFPKEKLEALRFYMDEKELTVEEELQKHINNIYDKYVPAATRRYFARNDEGVGMQEEPAIATNDTDSENTSRKTSTRGRRRTTRTPTTQEQVAEETINIGENEEIQEQGENQNQGMSMTM